MVAASLRSVHRALSASCLSCGRLSASPSSPRYDPECVTKRGLCLLSPGRAIEAAKHAIALNPKLAAQAAVDDELKAILSKL